MKLINGNKSLKIIYWLVTFFIIFACYYALHGSRITSNPTTNNRYKLLTGDEPHYLLLAHSIAFDNDIDLKNNKQQKDYAAFSYKPVSGYTKSRNFWIKYVKGNLQTAPDSYWKNRCYSVCPIGMPVLIAPAYKVGFLHGKRIRYFVVIFFHILAVLTVLISAYIILYMTKNWTWTIFCTICLAFSAPLLFYTVPIFPDLPGALFITTGTALFLALQNSSEKGYSTILIILIGIVSGYLPWIHARFWPLSAIIILFTVFHIFHSQQNKAALSVIFIISLITVIIPLLIYYYKLYGVPYPVSTHPPINLTTGFTSGWIGLWLDRNNGILWYTPLLILFFPGTVLMLRYKPLVGILITLLILANWGLIGMFSDWRAGLCPPLRYWLPVFPLMFVPCAFFLTHAKRLLAYILIVSAGGMGIIIAISSMLTPARLYRYKHPVFTYIEHLHYNLIAPSLFPTGKPVDYIISAIYIILITIATVTLIRYGTDNNKLQQFSKPSDVDILH